MKNYSYLKSNKMYSEENLLIISLFQNSDDNSSRKISQLSGVHESRVSEIISKYLGYVDRDYGTIADATRFHEVTESSIRDIAPIEHIIFQFNSKCYSSPDFSTRLQTLKTLR